MSVNQNIGAQSYLTVVEILRDALIDNELINTITLGDITEVDLNKQSIFPLAHIIVTNAKFSSTIITYSVDLLLMDIVYDDDTTNEPLIYRGDNENYVLNNMLNVGNHITDRFNNSDLNDGNTYILRESVTAEPFKDRFENLVAGWNFTFQVETRNNIDRCNT